MGNGTWAAAKRKGRSTPVVWGVVQCPATTAVPARHRSTHRSTPSAPPQTPAPARLPMAPDPDPVAQALAATLSNIAAERNAAESVLAHLATQDEHAAHLVQLAATSDPVVAPAAALRLKNLMRASRVSPTLSDAARARVRENVLPALAVVRGTNVEGVLAETTRWLVLLDFPAKWPTLLPAVRDYLSSGDAARVHSALIVLRQLVKCYEFKSRDPAKLLTSDPNDAGLSHPREPLDSIASALFPTLLALYIHLDQIVLSQPYENPDRRNACLAQRLIVKIFWSCTQFILPPCLAEPGVLDQWMSHFFATIRRPCKHPYVDDPNDVAHEPEWKTYKWIAHVITRFLKRYGSPKKVPIDEPWAKKVAEAFKEQHAEKATTVMLEVLSSETNGKQLSRRVAHLALDFIEEAIETAALWAVVRPHVDTLLARVVFPYLCFTEADEEIWIGDPSEYVRKQYDFTEDFTSPRMAASNLLSKMADLRSKSTVLPFLQYLLQSVLDPYLSAQPGSPQRISYARQKVGAFASLAAVKGKLMSKQDLSDSFLKVLKSHVEPDLRSEFGFLRSESAWLLGQVASCGWERFSKELGEVALRGCVTLLQDNELPVQAAAAGALQFLMEQDGPAELVRSVAPQLLERLLHLMDNMSDGYLSLLPALDKLVVRYPDEIMPLAFPLVQRLMAAFRHSAQGILNDGDDEDDDLAFTAAQVLHLVSSIITSIGEWEKPSKSEKNGLFLSIEKELQPLLSSMFDESHQVFVEELLDVLGILVVQMGELNDGLSPFLLSMIPKMVHGFDAWAADYVEHMMDAIEGYIMFDLRSIVSMEGGMGAFVGFIRKLWSEKFDDSDAVYGSRIGELLILNLCKMKPVPDQLVQQVVVELARLAAERCVRTSEDESALRQRLFSVVMLCNYLDATSVLKGLGSQSVMQLVATETANLQVFERIYAKKSLILGVGGILCTKGLVVEDSKPHLLNLALRLQEMIDRQRESASQQASQAGSNFASLTKDGNGFGGFGLHGTEDYGSDLDDDQDASNFLDEANERHKLDMEKLAEGTGFTVPQLEEVGASNGLYLGNGLFDVDDIGDDDDDEGGFAANPLDEIDEVEFLVKSVKESAVDPWWGKVVGRDQNAMEQLARRLKR